MQNRYTADLGDFGKYGLLRALCSAEDEGQRLKPGVVWYLVPDESHNSDGRFIQYLEPSAKNDRVFRQCDPELYDVLKTIIQNNERRISSIQNSGILPPETVFYDIPLTFDGMSGPAARKKRMAYRNGWVQGAISVTEKCDLVFLDPDNGLEVGTKRHAKRGPKYTFYDEIEPYWQRNQSLVIYQHTGRQGSAEKQIGKRFAQINGLIEHDHVFALLYHRGNGRAFIVVASENHQGILFKRAERFVRGPWSQHFELLMMDERMKCK